MFLVTLRLIRTVLLSMLLTLVGQNMAFAEVVGAASKLQNLTGGQVKLLKVGMNQYTLLMRLPPSCKDLRVENQQTADTITLMIEIPENCGEAKETAASSREWIYKKYDFQSDLAGMYPKQIGYTLSGKRQLYNWNQFKIEQTEASVCIECDIPQVLGTTKEIAQLKNIPLRSDVVQQEAEYGIATTIRGGSLNPTELARAATLPWLRSELKNYSDSLRTVVESITVSDSGSPSTANPMGKSHSAGEIGAAGQFVNEIPPSMQKQSETTYSVGNQIGVRIQSKNQTESSLKYELNLKHRVQGEGSNGEIGAKFSKVIQKNMHIQGEARSEFGGAKRAGIQFKFSW